MMRSALSVLLMMVLAGCSATPSKPRYAEATTAKPECVKSGTHIESRKGNCVQPGRSSGDLTRTHTSTAAGALRGVDPSITIRQ